jgi:hypothetical protein
MKISVMVETALNRLCNTIGPIKLWVRCANHPSKRPSGNNDSGDGHGCNTANSMADPNTAHSDAAWRKRSQRGPRSTGMGAGSVSVAS